MFKGKHLPFTSEKDYRIKMMNERINLTEKQFDELLQVFASYTRKLARFRNKNDDLARAFNQYSDEEQINQTLSNGVKNFSKALTFIADDLDLEVRRIEVKVLNEFIQYENVCKIARDNLRSASQVREKEFHRQKQLIDIRTKFSANSSAADSELLKVNLEVNRTNKQIDEIIESFERQKLHDIKEILLNFLLIQMKQHTKAIETLTETYQDIANIDEQQDFLEFKKLLKSKDKIQKTNLREEYHSQSMDNLPLASITSPLRQRRKNFSKNSKDLSVIGTEDEDEEELQDDDVDDSESDSDQKSVPDKDETTINDESASDSEKEIKPSKHTKNVFKAKKSREGIPLHSPSVNVHQPITSVKSISGVTKYQVIK